jgi:hypothetical protein
MSNQQSPADNRKAETGRVLIAAQFPTDLRALLEQSAVRNYRTFSAELRQAARAYLELQTV